MATAWQTIAEDIKLATVDRGKRIVALASPTGGAGVSTIASNVADLMARSGHRVLLLDMARHPSNEGSGHLWSAWLNLVEHECGAGASCGRELRTAMQAAMKQHAFAACSADRIAVTVSDLAKHIVDHASPSSVGVRAHLVGSAIRLELFYRGNSLPGIDDRIAAAGRNDIIDAGDPNLPLALAGRAVTSWTYSPGPKHRLVGWCALDRYAASGVTLAPVPGVAYDSLIADPSAPDRVQLSNLKHMRALLREEFAGYDAVLVDLAPILERKGERIDPLTTAAACDGLLLVGTSGCVSAVEMKIAQDRLAGAGVDVIGLVVNDVFSPTLASEMARESRRLQRFSLRFANWLERKFLASPFLNSI